MSCSDVNAHVLFGLRCDSGCGVRVRVCVCERERERGHAYIEAIRMIEL